MKTSRFGRLPWMSNGGPEDDRSSTRSRFPGFGGRRQRDHPIIPDAHDDETMTIQTTATTEDLNDTESDVIEIFRPELHQGARTRRGASHASMTTFLSFLGSNSEPRRRTKRPTFPGVTIETNTSDAGPWSRSKVGGIPGSGDDGSALEELFAKISEMGDLSEMETGSGEERGARNWTPLHYAAQRGSLRLCENFIKHGADLEATTDSGWTPLFYAASKNNVDIARLLLKEGAKPEVMGEDGQTPLIIAIVKHGRPDNTTDMISLLARRAKDIDYPYGQEGNHGSPLCFAAALGKSDVVELLLSLGADIEASDQDDDRVLSLAANQAHTEAVRVLLEHKAKVQTSGRRGWTPLHMVCQRLLSEASLEVARMLLEAGADPNVGEEDGDTSLHLATQCDARMVRLLLSYGADPLRRNDVGLPPLHRAIAKSNLDIINILLEYGANANYGTDGDGLPIKKFPNALHSAAAQDNPDVVRRILETDVDRDVLDENGISALMLASQNDNEEIALAFLQGGCKP